MLRAPLVAPTWILLVALAGCAPGGGGDAGTPDAGGVTDAGASGQDAGPVGDDAGPAGPSPGFGALDGCDDISADLAATSAAFAANGIDFGTDPWDDADYDELTAGGQEIIDDGNAGGSSLLSEVFAFEVLARCEGATLLKTETEIDYTDAQGKITDLLVEIDGRKIGVSVTRAIAFPFDAEYTAAQAQTLLEDKLQGVLDSTANVTAADAWEKQVLSVIAYTPAHATAVEQAWQAIDATLRADTVVYVTATDGDDGFLY